MISFVRFLRLSSTALRVAPPWQSRRDPRRRRRRSSGDNPRGGSRPRSRLSNVEKKRQLHNAKQHRVNTPRKVCL